MSEVERTIANSKDAQDNQCAPQNYLGSVLLMSMMNETHRDTESKQDYIGVRKRGGDRTLCGSVQARIPGLRRPISRSKFMSIIDCLCTVGGARLSGIHVDY